jgi:hypothetical protein
MASNVSNEADTLASWLGVPGKRRAFKANHMSSFASIDNCKIR